MCVWCVCGVCVVCVCGVVNIISKFSVNFKRLTLFIIYFTVQHNEFSDSLFDIF